MAPCENFPQTVARSFGSGWVLPVCRSISRGLGSVKHGACARPALHALHGRTAHDARAGARTRRTRARARGARTRARRTHARCTRARARAAAARRARSHARARAHCTLRDTRARTRLPRSPSHRVIIPAPADDSGPPPGQFAQASQTDAHPGEARTQRQRGPGGSAVRQRTCWSGTTPRSACHARLETGVCCAWRTRTRHAAAQAPSQTDVV